jgi:hypothetical protein
VLPRIQGLSRWERVFLPRSLEAPLGMGRQGLATLGRLRKRQTVGFQIV